MLESKFYKQFEKEWSELWFSFITNIPEYNRNDVSNLSCNPNTTYDIIRDNPDVKWDWNRISFNSNITW